MKTGYPEIGQAGIAVAPPDGRPACRNGEGHHHGHERSSCIPTLEEHRSYAGAAKKLYITPQRLSNAVRRLESALGLPLIINQSGVLTLTEYGRIAAENGRKIVSTLAAMQHKIDSLARSCASDLRLVAAIGLIDCLSNDLEKDLAESTSVHLKGIDLMPDYLGIQEVISGKYDYGLLPRPIDHPDLAEVPIYSDCLFAWVPDTNPLYGNETIANDDLTDFQLIFPSNDPEWTNMFSEFVRRSIPRARLKAADEMFMALRCAAQGEGIGITTRACVDPIEMRASEAFPSSTCPGASRCASAKTALSPRLTMSSSPSWREWASHPPLKRAATAPMYRGRHARATVYSSTFTPK